MSNLNQKVAVVTGSAQGIGAELALGLANAGAKVVLSDLNLPEETLERIKASGGEAIACVADVTDNDSIQAMVSQAEAELGPISVLVNNAGVFATIELKPFEEITEEEWDFVMRVNARGVFQVSKGVAPSMRKAGGGSIVNIGSGTMHRGAPFFMQYVASKGAVFAMTRCLARELADDKIRANCITVGFTASDGVKRHPEMLDKFGDYTINARILKREMIPSDLVGTVNYLAGDDSGFLTGQTINVDGGAVTY